MTATLQESSAKPYAAVVIAASTGGIEALRVVLANIDAATALTIIVVLHTASETHAGVCQLLRSVTSLAVEEAQMGEPALPGHVYLAPPGYHLLLEAEGSFALSVDEKVCHVRPSADVLFESAADLWGGDLIGVVLTGANDDGARGLKCIRDRGGLAVVQSPDEAMMPMMPQAALRIAGADHVLRLAELAALLSRRANA